MYLPSHFAQDNPAALHALMRAHPFATLLTGGGRGLTADHLPLHFDPAVGPRGALQGHVARANPLWREAAGQEALAVFHGPHAYVTPGWYPAKREHGKAVPTWNYVVVHARGRLAAIDDDAWLRRHLDRLVAEHEAGQSEPWRIDDAPADYVRHMMAATVGIELVIEGLVGKWKLSQNQPAASRAGVVAGLREQGDEAARAVADLVAGAPSR